MKKHNDGYVLAMVMVVIAVLAVVASTMLSVGLRNVLTQQNAVERMQAKYKVEGEVEKLVTKFVNLETGEVTDAESAFRAQFETLCKNYNDNLNDGIQIIEIVYPVHGSRIYTFTIESKGEYVVSVPDKETTKQIREIITIKKGIELEYQIEPITDGGINKEAAKVKNVMYASYETSTVQNGGNTDDET